MKINKLGCLLAASMIGGAIPVPVLAQDEPTQDTGGARPPMIDHNPVGPDDITQGDGDTENRPDEGDTGNTGNTGDTGNGGGQTGTPTTPSEDSWDDIFDKLKDQFGSISGSVAEAVQDKGRITVTLAQPETAGLDVKDVAFKLVRVADIIDGEYVYTEDFSSMAQTKDIDINAIRTSDDLKKAAFDLQKVYDSMKLDETVSDTVDSADKWGHILGDTIPGTTGTIDKDTRDKVNSAMDDLYQKVREFLDTGGTMVPSKATAYRNTILRDTQEAMKAAGLDARQIAALTSKITSYTDKLIAEKLQDTVKNAGASTVYEGKTDSKGSVVFDDLNVGVYLLFSTDIAGYELIAPTLLAIPTWDAKSESMSYDLKVEPKVAPLPQIKVKKLDSSNKKLITGKKFEFSLYSDEACTKLVEKQTDDPTDGDAQFLIKFGTWYIKETAAPEGYKVSDRIVKIVFDDKGVSIDGKKQDDNASLIFNTKDAKVYTVEFEDTPEEKPGEKDKDKVDFNTGIQDNTGWILAGIVACVIGIFAAVWAKRRNKA